MEIFKKTYKKHGGCNRDRLLKETKALQLLEHNFINDPKIDHYPFPKVIQIPHKVGSNLCNCYECQLHSEYPNKWRKQYPNVKMAKRKQKGTKVNPRAGSPVIPCYNITTTNCGISSLQNMKLTLKQKYIQPINVYNTVECIINNLRNANLIHTDIRGSNICINENGNISLIDFETISMCNASKVFIKRVNNFYKKPDLNELKDKLNLLGIENRFNIKTYKLSNKKIWNERVLTAYPWSILYMF